MQILCNLILAAIFLFNFPIYADIQTGTFTLDGYFLSSNIKISANTIQGNGTIRSPKVKINCDEFRFTGTINSDGECTIYTRKAFDYSSFKIQGSGKFTVIVSPYKIEDHSFGTLLNKATNIFIDNCLSISQERVSERLQDIRCNAHINNIDENKIIKAALYNIEQKIEYYHERLDQKRDNSMIPPTVVTGGAGLAGLVTTIKGFRNIGEISKRYKVQDGDIAAWLIVLGAISSGSMILSGGFLMNYLNPQFKERYEQLKLIKEEINKAILTPFEFTGEIVRLQ